MDTTSPQFEEVPVRYVDILLSTGQTDSHTLYPCDKLRMNMHRIEINFGEREGRPHELLIFQRQHVVSYALRQGTIQKPINVKDVTAKAAAASSQSHPSSDSRDGSAEPSPTPVQPPQ